MHHNIDYSKLEGKEKEDKAIQDVKDYLGDDEKFDSICAAIAETKSKEFYLHTVEMILGISGYPALAMWERYHV